MVPEPGKLCKEFDKIIIIDKIKNPWRYIYVYIIYTPNSNVNSHFEKTLEGSILDTASTTKPTYIFLLQLWTEYYSEINVIFEKYFVPDYFLRICLKYTEHASLRASLAWLRVRPRLVILEFEVRTDIRVLRHRFKFHSLVAHRTVILGLDDPGRSQWANCSHCRHREN